MENTFNRASEEHEEIQSQISNAQNDPSPLSSRLTFGRLPELTLVSARGHALRGEEGICQLSPQRGEGNSFGLSFSFTLQYF